MQHIAGLLLELLEIEKVYVDVTCSLAEMVYCIDPDPVVQPAAEGEMWESEAGWYKDFVLDEEIEKLGDKLVVVDQVGGLLVVVDKLLDIDYWYSYHDSDPAVSLTHTTVVVAERDIESASLLGVEVDLSIALAVVDLLWAVDSQIAARMAEKILLDHCRESGVCQYRTALESEEPAVLAAVTAGPVIVAGCTGSDLEDPADWIDSPVIGHIVPELAVQELWIDSPAIALDHTDLELVVDQEVVVEKSVGLLAGCTRVVNQCRVHRMRRHRLQRRQQQ